MALGANHYPLFRVAVEARRETRGRANGLREGYYVSGPTLQTKKRETLLECADVSTPPRLPRRGPRLSALWSLATVASTCPLKRFLGPRASRPLRIRSKSLKENSIPLKL